MGFGFEKVFRVSEKDLSNVQHTHLEREYVVEIELRCLFSGYLSDGDLGRYRLIVQCAECESKSSFMHDCFVCIYIDLPWIRG